MDNSNTQRLTITITGGSGFLGTELTHALLKEGHKIKILDHATPEASILNRVEFFEGSITDQALVEKAVAGSQLVYHIAAIIPISKKSKSEFLAINADGTKYVLEASLKAGARVVFCSTSSPLYDKAREFPVTEETPQSPAYFYGQSKHVAEGICNEYRKRGLQVTIIRPRMIIGPGRLGLIEILSKWIAHGDPIPLLGDGSNRLQFLDVADLVDLLMLLINANPTAFNDDYNVGAKRFGMLRDDLQYVITETKSQSRLVPLPRLYRPLLVLCNAFNLTPFTFFHLNTIDRTFYFDTAKAEKNLGWKSKYSNADGLLRSYNWYIENSEKIGIGEGHRKKLKKIGLVNVLPSLLRIYSVVSAVFKWLAEFLATGLYVGHLAPFARGTFGALLGMLFLPLFSPLSLGGRVAFIVCFTLISILCGQIAEKRLIKKGGQKDDGRIVIDEVASIFITFLLLPQTSFVWPVLILGFFLNRFFDVVKLPPSKMAEKLSGGWGIVLDDTVSGIYSLLALTLVLFLF